MCDIYKSALRADTYLYLKTDLPLEELPEGLLQLLGDLRCFLTLELDEQSKLAQVDSGEVLTALEEQGYFLQLPPPEQLRQRIPGSDFIQ